MERYIDLRASTPCDLSLAEIITSGGLLKYKNGEFAESDFFIDHQSTQKDYPLHKVKIVKGTTTHTILLYHEFFGVT